MRRAALALAAIALLTGCVSLIKQSGEGELLPPQSVEESTAQIRTATTEFYHFIGYGRYAEAYRNVASGSGRTEGEFVRSVTRRYPEGTKLFSFRISGVTVDGDLGTVSVEAQWTRGRAQTLDSVTLGVVRQVGGWKIQWNN